MSDFAVSIIGDPKRKIESETSRPGLLSISDLPNASGMASTTAFPTLRSVVAEAQIRGILGALEHTGWNRRRAAKLLAVSYRTLLYKMRRYNIARLSS